MSVDYCHKHHNYYDTDFETECYLCVEDEVEQSEQKEKGKKCFIHNATKSFKIEVHNKNGAWYEIVLADSYLEAKIKVEKAYPNNTHVSLEYEYDKPIF